MKICKKINNLTIIFLFMLISSINLFSSDRGYPGFNVEEEKKLIIRKNRIDKGKLLFDKCSTCHGKYGEKSALETSAIIKGWRPSKVLESFNIYKNYEKKNEKKIIMKKMLLPYSESDLKSLAEYISAL